MSLSMCGGRGEEWSEVHGLAVPVPIMRSPGIVSTTQGPVSPVVVAFLCYCAIKHFSLFGSFLIA
eukprot:3403681-Prorocentrum_lima.AAC.1